ncbi:MAG: DUF4256 domain-containing protein [Acidobacteria bacterium]|nr:DUF4256 domain-containing protein [Acidobacteriota bacterium]
MNASVGLTRFRFGRTSNQVFVYHNGAESYYQSRAFRGRLDV